MPKKVARSPSITSLKLAWCAELDDYAIAAAICTQANVVAGASASGTLTFFDSATGIVRATTMAHAGGVTCLATCQSSSRFASGGNDGQIRLWNAQTAVAVSSFDAGNRSVSRVAYNSEGDLLAASAGKITRLFDPAGGLVREFEPASHTIADIEWIDAARPLLATAGFGGVRLFRAGLVEPVQRLEHTNSSLALACSSGGKFVATGNQDCSVKFWRVAATREGSEDGSLTMEGYSRKPLQLCWDNSGRDLATGGGGNIVIWDCAEPGPDGRTPRELHLGHGHVTALAWQPQGVLLLSGHSTGHAAIWNPRKKAEPLAVFETPSPVTQVQWIHSRSVMTAGEGGHLSMLTAE